MINCSAEYSITRIVNRKVRLSIASKVCCQAFGPPVKDIQITLIGLNLIQCAQINVNSFFAHTNRSNRYEE